MSNTVEILVFVAVRLTMRLVIPCLSGCFAFIVLNFAILNGGEWPRFADFISVATFGGLFGLILGCAAKDFMSAVMTSSEDKFTADRYGSTGLLLGFVGAFVLSFAAPVFAIELTDFNALGHEAGGLMIWIMGVSVLGGVCGVILGEIIAFIRIIRSSDS